MPSSDRLIWRLKTVKKGIPQRRIEVCNTLEFIHQTVGRLIHDNIAKNFYKRFFCSKI